MKSTTILALALLLNFCASAAPLYVTAPSHLDYTITDASVNANVPSSCNTPTYRWYKDGVLTDSTSKNYTIPKFSDPELAPFGETHAYVRATFCADCGEVYRSREVFVTVGLPLLISIDCNNIVVKGSYKTKTEMGGDASRYITLPITCDMWNTLAGSVTYTAQTDVIGGLSFAGSGTLNDGNNTLQLDPHGVPTKFGTNTFHVTVTATYNSQTIASNTCTVSVSVHLETFKIAIYSQNSTNSWNMGNNNAAIPRMVDNNNKCNISGANNLCAVDAFTVEDYKNVTFDNKTAFPSDCDLMVIAYDKDITKVTGKLRDSVINKRMPLVVCQEGIGSARTTMLLNFANMFASGSITGITEPTNQTEPFPFVAGAPVVDGPYRNIAGKPFGADGSDNLCFQGVNTDVWYVVAGTSAKARIIMHKIYPLIIIGDAGALSGGYGGSGGNSGYRTDATYNPAEVEDNGTPIDKQEGSGRYAQPVYNSSFLLNILEWAVKWKGER